MKITIILTLNLVLSFAVHSQSSHKLLGRFIQINERDSQNILTHDIYFTLETTSGEQMAYPVVFKNEALKSEVTKNIHKDYVVEATHFDKEIFKGEFKQKTKFLKVEDANSLELKNLSLAYKEQTYTNGKYDPKGIKVGDKVTVMKPGNGLVTIDGLNDTVTNTAIFLGGAALLAKILLRK